VHMERLEVEESKEDAKWEDRTGTGAHKNG